MREGSHIMLILGGTRSGKSAYAESLLPGDGASVLYVATAESRPEDSSMIERIRRHRARRPAHWSTLECPSGLAAALLECCGGEPPDAVLIDCITMLASNVMFSLREPEDLEAFEMALQAEVGALLEAMRRIPSRWILVSGETGLGVTAPTRLGRHFCDGLGMANQMIAREADRVALVVAGRVMDLP